MVSRLKGVRSFCLVAKRTKKTRLCRLLNRRPPAPKAEIYKLAPGVFPSRSAAYVFHAAPVCRTGYGLKQCSFLTAFAAAVRRHPPRPILAAAELIR